MDLARLLWARVTAAHAVIGAPYEPFDEFTVGDWEFYPLGEDGVLGIKLCPDLDGDALVIAMPTKPSRAATLSAIRVMRKHMATGRILYSLAWKEHWAAININQRIGGQLMGLDGDGYYHFKHSIEDMTHGSAADRNQR